MIHLSPLGRSDDDGHHLARDGLGGSGGLAVTDAASRGSPTEALAGVVERVTFHNEETGFCVLRVKARGQRDLITVVGHAATIAAGEFVQLSGTWINDRTHGLQFRASFLKASPPTTLEGIERYLGSGMIQGIGPVYASRLVQTFGDAVFDLIEQQPERLREVRATGRSSYRVGSSAHIARSSSSSAAVRCARAVRRCPPYSCGLRSSSSRMLSMWV